MKTPTPDQMRLAADWCESNDGDESKELAPVVKWLREYADKQDLEIAVRKLHRQTGYTPSMIREKLRRMSTPVIS